MGGSVREETGKPLSPLYDMYNGLPCWGVEASDTLKNIIMFLVFSCRRAGSSLIRRGRPRWARERNFYET